MADTFGIFVENSVPTVQGVLKDVPTFIKGKGNPQLIKKKALGDVSNTVSQKVQNVQPNEKGGKLLADSCSTAREEIPYKCKPLSDLKETPKETPDGCMHCCRFSEDDYDIVPKSARLTGREIDLCSSFYSIQSFSPISSPASDFDLPDFSTSVVSVPVPFDELEDLPLLDVSVPSLDESDLSDDMSF